MKSRVLILAEAANPEWVSVPLVGWSMAQALRQIADTHLVTQIRNKPAIERAGLEHGKDFTAINTEHIAQPVYRFSAMVRGGTDVGFTTGAAFARIWETWFEVMAWRLFKPRLLRGEFDIVHRVTPLSPSAGGFFARQCKRHGIPFVWGPINGGVKWPPGFERLRREERELPGEVREIFKLLPGYAASRDNAAALLMGASIAKNELPERWQDRAVYIPENAIDPDRFTRRRQGAATLPLKVIFVGRLVPLKGLDMLISALAPLMLEGKVHLTVIGDGKERKPLTTRCELLNVAPYVDFKGFVPHHEVQDHLVNADVFGFPSIREFGGGAVLEAMATGVPPIILDYAGPAELVTPATGWKVPLTNRHQIEHSLRETFRTIIADPSQIEKRGNAARARVERWFTWKRKAEMIGEVYDWVSHKRPDKPDFPVPLPD